MAVTYTDNGDLFIAAALDAALWELLVDATNLASTCTYLGSVNGTGSLASKVAQVDWGDAMAAANVNETTTIGGTDLTVSSATITVARQAIERDVSDIYSLVGGPRPGVEQLAEKMALAAQLRFTDMVAALYGSLSSSVGTSGAAMTVDDFYDAAFTLIRARAPGKRYCVLSEVQLVHFIRSVRSIGSEVKPADANSMVDGVGDNPGWGLYGSFGNCEIWSSDSVVTNGANDEGAMYTKRAFAYKDGVPPEAMSGDPRSFTQAMPDGSSVFVEWDRDPGKAWTIVVGNYYVGVSEMEDACGVLISTSATA